MPISVILEVHDHTLYAQATWTAKCSDSKITFGRRPVDNDCVVETFRTIRRDCVRQINGNPGHMEVVLRDHDARKKMRNAKRE